MSLLTGNILIDIASFVVAIFAAVYAYYQWSFQFWKRKGIPYFKPTFPTGNKAPSNEDLGYSGNVFEVIKEAKKKGWNYFGYFMGPKPIFIPLDLEMIKCIMTKDFNCFTDRGFYYNERDDPLSAHLFSIGGVKWRNLRMKLTPTFTSGKMRSMFQTLVDCSVLLENTLKEHDSREPIDIKHLLACFTIDIIGSCAFGLECNSFKEPNSPFLIYGRKSFTGSRRQHIVGVISEISPKLASALHLCATPSDVTKFYFDIVTKTVDYREKNNVTRNDFLQLLINLRNNKGDDADEYKGDGTALTMNEIVAQCFIFFLAGFETSSTTMTFALYELATHPEIQEKVREELSEVLKKHDNKITYDSVKELEYMQQVIDETLRMYPPVPFVTRECMEDYKFPNTDVFLEKGIVTLIPMQNIHYDESVYENPHTFDPERFSPDNKKARHQYAHLPFGEGPRICIGMRFGLMQTKMGMATILKNFRVTVNSKTKVPLEMDPKTFIPSTKGGIWLNLEKI